MRLGKLRTENLEALLKISVIFYGFIGFLILLILLFFGIFGPSLEELDVSGVLSYFLILGIVFLNVTVCFLLAYSFLKLKKWGRYLAIIFNSLWLGTYAFGFVVARITEKNLPKIPISALMFLLLMFTPFIIIIVICFKSETKNIMQY